LAAIAIAVGISGCANFDMEAGQWFAKPLDIFGREGGYTYSELQETRQRRPITANDLVQPGGVCPPPPAAAAQAQPNPAVTSNPGATPVVANNADGLLGGGIALDMSECNVVYRAGQPTSVEIGQNASGDRTAVLTFDSGPRPGIYRFERGRLTQLDRVATSPPPPQTAKNKPAKTKKPPKSHDQS
jgi:hypothetical protein